MIISYSRTFRKNFKKQLFAVQNKFSERLELFGENPHHSQLGNHALGGEWLGCRSINVTGDIRAVFEEIDDNYVEFVDIGSHSELYS